MAKSDRQGKHAATHYQRISEEIIDELQRTSRTGGDLYRVASWISHEDKRIIVAVTLDADQVVTLSLRRLVDEAGPGPMTDFKRAVVADLLAEAPAAADGPTSAEALEQRAMALLQDVALSPTVSPLLDYEPLYRDLAEAALLVEDDPTTRATAVDWLKRAVAHNLRYEKGDDVIFGLIDLASAYLQLDNLDLGLTMLADLLRREPANIWVYRFMATGLGVVGLHALAQRAAARGLVLADETDDPEDLHDEFLMSEFELEAGPKGGREAQASPAVLADILGALALDFGSGIPASPDELCEELVPGWDDVPVKAPLRWSDLPAAIREGIS